MQGLIEAKRVVIDIVELLSSRFGQYVGDYILPFFEKIWEMLEFLPEAKEESLKLSNINNFVSSITNYLNSSLRHKQCKDMIQANLEYLFSKFLVKHMKFTADDLEEFDGDEISFIKMDLEENDKETRRRNCFNLVKRLTHDFPTEVKKLVGQIQESY